MKKNNIFSFQPAKIAKEGSKWWIDWDKEIKWIVQSENLVREVGFGVREVRVTQMVLAVGAFLMIGQFQRSWGSANWNGEKVPLKI